MKKICFFLLSCIFFGFPVQGAPLKVVATFSILGNMVQEIGGNEIHLITIVGPNSDAHTYEPTPQDAKNILEADLVFVNGLGFEEGWIRRLLKLSPKTPVVIATEGLQPRQAERETNGVPDPHAWHNVAHARVYAANIHRALRAVRPGANVYFQKNFQRFDQELQDLDRWVRDLFAKIPKERRLMVTSHDAFGYFGDAYDIQEWSLMGISTDAEASARDFAQLIDTIKKRQVRAVFLENITSPKLMEQIAAETHVTLGGTLYSDALSQPCGPAGTYVQMIRHNVKLLYKAME